MLHAIAESKNNIHKHRLYSIIFIYILYRFRLLNMQFIEYAFRWHFRMHNKAIVFAVTNKIAVRTAACHLNETS